MKTNWKKEVSRMKRYQAVLAVSSMTLGLLILGGCSTGKEQKTEPEETVLEEITEENDEPEEKDSDIENVSEKNDDTSTEKELVSVEEQAAALQNRIQNEDLTQTELNTLTAELYQLWDTELNQIWGRLKDTLDEETMKKLTEEERNWIIEKEQQVKEAGTQYEGGSMQSMVENQKAAELTKARVYELVESYLD